MKMKVTTFFLIVALSWSCKGLSDSSTNHYGSGYDSLQQNCLTAWECCIHEHLSDEFQQCCNDHGCCPLCDKYWLDGCCYKNQTYSFGSILEKHPDICVQFVCVAETMNQAPYVKATEYPMFYDPGPLQPACEGSVNSKCVDKYGILRAEGAEWFVSATCEQCQCLRGTIECRPVKRPCPPPPNPNCIPKPGGCCPNWDCGTVQLDATGCSSNDGTHYKYGQTWWDKNDHCIYNKCSLKGILHYKKDCSKIPPPPNPSCRLVKPESECCEKWHCGSQCPDPSSYGRVCIHYFDQCKTDKDCKYGESCCLVAGCGHECMSLECPDPNSFGRKCYRYLDQCETSEDCKHGHSCCLVAGCGYECMKLCKDSSGAVHNTGEVWYDQATKQKLICNEDGIHAVNAKGVYYPDPVYSTEVELYPKPHTLAQCLSSGINLTQITRDLQTLRSFSDRFPFKDPEHYVTGYREIILIRTSLAPEDTQRIQELALKFNWSAVIPLLSRNTTSEQLSAISAGDASLQLKNVVTQAIAQKNDTLPADSPSEKHQVAFRRTDPISTKMAQLGAVIEEATSNFVQSFKIPITATTALPILGEVSDCAKRFKDFFRPNLSPPCDPASPFRTLDGTCNNLHNDLWGAAFTKFRRLLPPAYGDGVSALRRAASGEELPSARLVSIKVNSKKNVESPKLAFLHVSFAQFIDHDLTATPIAKGYLGSSIKCCDDLRTKLDLAVFTLNTTKQVIQDLKLTEPSLKTNETLGELEITLNSLSNLKVLGEAFFTNQTTVRPARQVNQQFSVSSKIVIPIRPQSPECAPIPIPSDDPLYSCYGETCMEFVRSAPAPSCIFGPREQLNQHTAYLDGSVIYGVKKETTDSLRAFTDGLLKHQVTHENEEMLPADEDINDGCNIPEFYNNGLFCFKAGDGRVNEQVMLALIQTVWAREHNRVARILKSYNNIGWDDERLFQETRRIVVAELQHVTFKEFLPNILGSLMMDVLQLSPLSGDEYTTDYDEFLDASIANSFATAAYRHGHSQIADYIHKVNKHGQLHTDDLSTHFFKPFSLYGKEAMEDLLRGSASSSAAKVDGYFTDEVAGKLFKGHLPYGLDLVALNIQRGRDHGLPGYIEYKALCGSPVTSFNDLSSVMDDNTVQDLKKVYKKVEDIDLFVGAIVERPFLDGILGPTFSCMLADQFVRLKRGDRFWYEYQDGPGAFSTAQLKQIRRVTFARILCNNLPELKSIQPDPFKNLGNLNPRVLCSSPAIPDYILMPWKI